MKSSRQIIVGHTNTFHDPAFAIMEGDKIFAEAVERHTQCKRAVENNRLWYSWRAVRKALSDLGLWPVKDADIANISCWDFDLLLQTAKENVKVDNIWEYDPNEIPLTSILMHNLALEPLLIKQTAYIIQGYPAAIGVPMDAQLPGPNGNNNTFRKPVRLEHHLAHAANAVYTSPFDECISMVIDGYGENTSMGVYHFADNKFKSLDLVKDTHSLGFLYGLVTRLCGFNGWEGEEWKVMGLAPYGNPNPDIYNFFNDNIKVEGLNVQIKIDGETVLSELKPAVGGFRQIGAADVMHSADLAYNFQKWFEETVIKMLQDLSELGLSKNLAYGGGCALNSSVNGKILNNTGFEQLHIPSAPADDGNSLGAALHEKYCVRGEKRDKKIMSPYLGTEIDIKKLEKILDFKGTKFRKLSDESALCSEVADIIAAGNIIGWVQGRAEFGPRALGNRSVLADPRPADIKDRINKTIKFRESFRPFAPSVLHEFGNEYFEDYQESPYMERTLVFRKDVCDRIPAVVHRNGTGRIQTVKEEWNPLYYRLIHSFYKKTGIPILLNTSFNIMGKPIIHSVEDAITVFYTTGMDYLVIGNYILEK